MQSQPYNFKLSMTNSAPTFQSKLQSGVQRVQLSKEFNFALPGMIDHEKNEISV